MLCSQCEAPGGNTPGPQHHVECMSRMDSVCPECGYGADDCAHGRPPIRVSRNDERFIGSVLTWYSTETTDKAASKRAIELSRRFR